MKHAFHVQYRFSVNIPDVFLRVNGQHSYKKALLTLNGV
jgi:hypothetical protein